MCLLAGDLFIIAIVSLLKGDRYKMLLLGTV